MVQTNMVAKEATLKIIYYGISGAGKKTNLQWIYQQTPSSRKSQLQEEVVEQQQAFSFEYFAEPFFQISGMKVKCILYSVSSEVLSPEWSKKYFEEIDGIVFVVDSQAKCLKNNIDAFKALENILKQNNCQLTEIPLIFQYNKQDFPDITSLEELNTSLNHFQCPFITASAISGEGIWKTLDTILKKVKYKIQNQLSFNHSKLSSKMESNENQTIGQEEASQPKEKTMTKDSDTPEGERPSLKITTKLPQKWLKKTKPMEIQGKETKQDQEIKQEPDVTNKPITNANKPTTDEVKEPLKADSLPPQEVPSEQIKLLETQIDTQIIQPLEQEKLNTEEDSQSEDTIIDENKDNKDNEYVDKQLETILNSPFLSEKEEAVASTEKIPRLEESETKRIAEIPFDIQENIKKDQKIDSKKLDSSSKKTHEKPEEVDLEIFHAKEIFPPEISQEPTTVLNQFKASESDAKSSKSFIKKLIPPPKKPLRASLPEKSNQEALEILKSGKTLENARFNILDLRNQTFEKAVTIQNCEINQILADGSDFNGALTISNTNIMQRMIFGGENPSLFKNTFTLKDVEIQGEVNLEKIIFSKKVTFISSKLSAQVKMHEALFENGIAIMNAQITELLCQRSHFRGPFTVTDTNFENELGLQNSKFQGVFLISSSQFQRAHFMNAVFQNKAEFLNCTFEKSGNFGKIQCEKDLTIIGCLFYGAIHLGEAYLKGELYIRRTEFFHDASFSRILAGSVVVFEKDTFNSIADFSVAEFRHTKFLQTKFGGVTNFQETIFGDSMELLECEFNQRVHFSRAVFMQKVDFRETKFNGLVSFANVIGDYILLTRSQIEGKLSAEKEKDYAVTEQEYLTLRKIFEKHAKDDDRDWAHWHAQRAARKKIPFQLLKPWKMLSKFADYLFLDLGCGYGTKPVNVIFLSLVAIVIFSLIYMGFPPEGMKSSEPMQFQKILNCCFTSAVTFLPAGLANWDITVLHIDNTKESIAKFLMLAENTLGMFLLLLFTMTFFRKLLRY